MRNVSLLVALVVPAVIASAQPPELNEARILNGHIETGITSHGEIIVAVDQDYDQIVDHAFLVASPRPELLASISLSDARITLTSQARGLLPIESQESSERVAWLVAVNEQDHQAATEREERLANEGFSYVEILPAFGISYYWDLDKTPEAERINWKGLSISRSILSASVMAADKIFHQYPGGGSTGGGECDAGGPGSGSCTISGCLGQPDGCSTGGCSSGLFPCCRCVGDEGARCSCVN